jgi:hypothetical protein
MRQEDTMTTIMYDAESNSEFPPGAPAYAAYVDGHAGDQPNYAHVTAAYPDARHLSIALSADDDADALDVENGAASPADVPGWIARQHVRGVVRPCVYASVSVMKAEILPLVGGWLPASVRLWTAHYDGEHICGPKSCGQLPVDADGTQWTSGALGRQLDQSILNDDFFGAPAPATVEADVTLQQLENGSTGQAVQNWQGLLVAHALGYLIATGKGNVMQQAGVDGSFGAKTEAATKRFQAGAGLPATGVVDAATWQKALG